MSDPPPPEIARSADQGGAAALSGEAIDAILSDFRAWLEHASLAPPAEPAPELDVATVIQHFIALRHEVNLQTKASRAQLEQNAQTIEMLQEALGDHQRTDRADADDDERLRPLLKTLIDTHDALTLAEREVERLLSQPPATAWTPPPPLPKLTFPYWTRWFGLGDMLDKQLAPLRTWHESQSRPPAEDTRYRAILDALLVGYRMSRERIERAIVQHDLEPIPCVGLAFDAETMEVAEVVREAGRASSVVLEEVRRGYRWRGRLFRCAQVRVLRS